MGCMGTTWLSDREYLEEFHQKAVQFRIPLSGSIELTHRCNLRCVHCYLGPEPAVDEAQKHEMDTHRVLSVIDEITDAGCLFLVLTGGEPLLRTDFAALYRHAKSNGLLVTVFTNGTLLTDSILDLFSDLPPHTVEITLYGASAQTYEKITGVKGSYDKCLKGIRRLLERNIDVRLKTILMSLNEHELLDMESMAKECGVRFRFDAAIFPRFNGDKTPLSLRVSPEEAVEKELSDSERLRQWRDFLGRYRELPASETLYTCGAGLTSFHIDPHGNLMPCLMTVAHKFDLRNDAFLSVWNDAIARVREKRGEVDFVCNKCENQIICGYCPAFFGLESGSEDVQSEYLCSMGKLRSLKIHRGAQGG